MIVPVSVPRRGAWLVCLLALAPGPVAAQDDGFHITAAEKAACTSDAIRFCAYTYPSEGRLLVCMRSNRSNLSASCRPVFEAGLRRRGLL